MSSNISYESASVVRLIGLALNDKSAAQKVLELPDEAFAVRGIELQPVREAIRFQVEHADPYELTRKTFYDRLTSSYAPIYRAPYINAFDVCLMKAARKSEMPALMEKLNKELAVVEATRLLKSDKPTEKWEGVARAREAGLSDKKVKALSDAMAKKHPVATSVTWMSEINERTITWLWRDRIPLGCMTLISGTGGVNKSTVMYDLAARLSAGKPFPLSTDTQQGKTIIVSGEDDPQTIIRPRLRIAGADLSKIGILDIRECVDGVMRKKRFCLTDLQPLEMTLASTPEVKMVVIDPVGSFGGKANGDKQFDVMQITSALNDLAARFNVAIVVCQHLNKSSAGGQRGLRDRLMGSAGWFDGCRSCFLVTLDTADPNRRCLSHGKSNHSQLQESLCFEVSVTNEGDSQIISLKWDTQTTAGTADDMLMASNVQGEDVEQWLRERLAGGEVSSQVLKHEATEKGIHQQRLWRASDKLGVVKRKSGMAGGWSWSLRLDTPTSVEPIDNEDKPF